MNYCAVPDLYAHGVRPGDLPNPGRLIASVSSGADSLTVDDYGAAAGDLVTFRAEAGGSLPAPISEDAIYYVIPIDDARFSISAAPDGGAIDITSAGERFLAVFKVSKDAAIAWASALIDDMLPAHVVPLATVPPIVRMTCAELAAAKLLGLAGSGGKSLTDIADAARKRVERWAQGVPIRGTNAPAPASLAQSASAANPDLRGWGRFGGIG